MALINFARREIEVKIVFYGPAYSGKTTNVEILHRLMPPTQRGELHSLRTEQDRTLFFDYVPVTLGEIAGFTARFKLFTVPGQVFYKETRRVLLQGADAVVFVADSSPGRATANLEALLDLEENLAAHRLDLRSIPLVIQLNKRDVPDAQAPADMEAELNPFGVPVIEASAAEGRGVLDTLRRITDIAGQRIRENLAGHSTAVALTAVEHTGPEDDRRVVREHMEAIRKVRPLEHAGIQHLRDAGQLHARDVEAVLSELVVRSEDVTPPDPIPPPNDFVDELPVAEHTPARGLHHEKTPARAQAEELPAGDALNAWIDRPDLVLVDLRAAEVHADGIRLVLVSEHDGLRMRHAVSVATRAPAEPEIREVVREVEVVRDRPAPLKGAMGWAAFSGATFITAFAGMLLGLALGWMAFAR